MDSARVGQRRRIPLLFLCGGALQGGAQIRYSGWPDLYRILNQERKAEKNESEDFLAVWFLTCPGASKLLSKQLARHQEKTFKTFSIGRGVPLDTKIAQR